MEKINVNFEKVEVFNVKGWNPRWLQCSKKNERKQRKNIKKLAEFHLF